MKVQSDETMLSPRACNAALSRVQDLRRIVASCEAKRLARIYYWRPSENRNQCRE